MDTIRPVISKPLTRTAPDRSEDTPPLQQLIADFLPTLWEVPHFFSPSTGPHAVTRGLDPAPGDAPRPPLHTTMNPRTGEGRAAAGGSVEEGQGCSAAAAVSACGCVCAAPSRRHRAGPEALPYTKLASALHVFAPPSLQRENGCRRRTDHCTTEPTSDVVCWL